MKKRSVPIRIAFKSNIFKVKQTIKKFYDSAREADITVRSVEYDWNILHPLTINVIFKMDKDLTNQELQAWRRSLAGHFLGENQDDKFEWRNHPNKG